MSEPIRGTIVIDSLGELARLAFSKGMKKNSSDVDRIRGVSDYPGMTERVNIIFRKMKEMRNAGWYIYITAHDGIDKIYAKGGPIGTKDKPAEDPVAIKGRPDLPGNTGPTEIMRACDNVWRVRKVGQNLCWIAFIEPIGPGMGDWEVKDRFGAIRIKNGFLPPSWSAIESLALADPEVKKSWDPPYITMVYGPQGMQKTRAILTFPPPYHIFNFDDSLRSISAEMKGRTDITVYNYNTEQQTDYDKFMVDFISLLGKPGDITIAKQALGVK